MPDFDDNDDGFLDDFAKGGRRIARERRLSAARAAAAAQGNKRIRDQSQRGHGMVLFVDVQRTTDGAVELAAYWEPANVTVGWVPRVAVEAVAWSTDALDANGFPLSAEATGEELRAGYRGLVRLARWKLEALGWQGRRPRVPEEGTT